MTTALPLPVAGLETRMHLPAGTLAGAELDAATAALTDATSLALGLEGVPTSLAADWLDRGIPDTVAVCIYKAARREFENPSGLSQEIEGEHTITTSATTGVFFTPLETQTILTAAGRPSKGFVGTIRTPSPYDFRFPIWR